MTDEQVWLEIVKAAAVNAISIDDIIPIADAVLAAFKARFRR